MHVFYTVKHHSSSLGAFAAAFFFFFPPFFLLPAALACACSSARLFASSSWMHHTHLEEAIRQPSYVSTLGTLQQTGGHIRDRKRR